MRVTSINRQNSHGPGITTFHTYGVMTFRAMISGNDIVSMTICWKLRNFSEFRVSVLTINISLPEAITQKVITKNWLKFLNFQVIIIDTMSLPEVVVLNIITPSGWTVATFASWVFLTGDSCYQRFRYDAIYQSYFDMVVGWTWRDHMDSPFYYLVKVRILLLPIKILCNTTACSINCFWCYAYIKKNS